METITSNISQVLTYLYSSKAKRKPKHFFINFKEHRKEFHYFLKSKSQSAWMKTLPKSTKLRSLALVGTHNSNTYNLNTKLLLTFSRCQKFTVFEQLLLGVRYLDIRYCMNEEKFLKSLNLTENHLISLLKAEKKDYKRIEQYLKVFF